MMRAGGQTFVPRLLLESPAFKTGDSLPMQYTADGRNVSPPITWRNVPRGTVHLVLSFQDDDEIVPLQSPFFHWVVYNIPPEAKGLPEGIPSVETITAPPDLIGSYQAYTAFSFPSYRGPQPPPGHTHHYKFVLRAIGTDVGLSSGLFSNAVVRALDGHVLAQSEIDVTYTRKVKA
jgi:Raf kinase inhibitor-like YbhB/YbcL family protein